MSAFEETKRKCLFWDECMRLSLLFYKTKNSNDIVAVFAIARGGFEPSTLRV